MKKKNIFIAILAGGKGERLWPKSRIYLPKQNLRLLDKMTFVQRVVMRARKITPKNIFIVTGKDGLSYTMKQLKTSAVKRIVVEPFARNTAPAVGLATLLANRENKDSILIAMPSDSLISNEKNFLDAIDVAINTASKRDVLVTLGISPTTASTAYGYIGIDKGPLQIFAKKPYKVSEFREKPTLPVAQDLVRSGRYFWNSGIFIFKTSVMLEMLKRYTPNLYKGLMDLPGINNKRSFDRRLKSLYRRLESKSLDYAVLEKTKDIEVIPSDFHWSDLGTFESIANLAKKDRNGNVVFGSHVGIDTRGSFIFSDEKRLIGTIGIDDIIVVATPDAVLICDRRRAEEIKKLVSTIKKKKKFAKFL